MDEPKQTQVVPEPEKSYKIRWWILGIIAGVALVIVGYLNFFSGSSEEKVQVNLVTVDEMNSAISSAVAEAKEEFQSKLDNLQAQLDKLTVTPTTTTPVEIETTTPPEVTTTETESSGTVATTEQTVSPPTTPTTPDQVVQTGPTKPEVKTPKYKSIFQ